MDKGSNLMPEASNNISFSISGPAEIVATDNGDPSDLVAFPSKERKAFSGMALVIVRSKDKQPGKITLTAKAQNLHSAELVLTSGF